MFIVVLFGLNNYTVYYWERNKRRDFAVLYRKCEAARG
jgi:hypothetical protein